MIKKIVWALTCLVINTAAAQEIDKPPNKWDASIDMYHLFQGYGNVMLRYAPKETGAYRMRLSQLSGGKDNQFSYIDSTGRISSKPQIELNAKSSIVNLYLGYEFHKNRGKHQFFYGFDIGYSRSTNRAQPSSLGLARNSHYQLAPFVGLKYRLFNCLSISGESNISFGYQVLKNFYANKNVLSKTNSIAYYFHPVRAINLTYHF